MKCSLLLLLLSLVGLSLGDVVINGCDRSLDLSSQLPKADYKMTFGVTSGSPSPVKDVFFALPPSIQPHLHHISATVRYLI